MTVEIDGKERRFIKYNNWEGKLPDDHYLPIFGEPKVRPGYFREMVDRNGGMDEVLGKNCSNKKGHSEQYLGQAYREFFLIIDRLIEETGIKEELDAYTRQIWESDLSSQTHIWKPELERITEPVIQRMLVMGYTRWDLAS